jgi:class 3 adenylate cyclase
VTVQSDQLSILYADMCDSVRLYERLGDAEGHRLAEYCMGMLVQITEQLGGALIRTQGDGIMSTFPDAVTACRAARAMQEAHRCGPVSIKVGFNQGAVIHGGGDVYGDAVNLAARVMGRSQECQLAVESDFASRRHAVIESRRDHFVLTDQSTNGTYLITRDGEQVYLKRESARLIGSGTISLGVRPQEEGGNNLIRFSHHRD